MEFEFEVTGYFPPKKDLDYSSWSRQDNRVDRVYALRDAAYSRIKEAGRPDFLDKKVSLEVNIFLFEGKDDRADLDNYVSGICDALQVYSGNDKATKLADFKAAQTEKNLPDEISPDAKLVIENDRNIMKITAEKKYIREGNLRYTVSLKPHPPA